jgi:hypothetical protein
MKPHKRKGLTLAQRVFSRDPIVLAAIRQGISLAKARKQWEELMDLDEQAVIALTKGVKRGEEAH